MAAWEATEALGGGAPTEAVWPSVKIHPVQSLSRACASICASESAFRFPSFSHVILQTSNLNVESRPRDPRPRPWRLPPERLVFPLSDLIPLLHSHAEEINSQVVRTFGPEYWQLTWYSFFLVSRGSVIVPEHSKIQKKSTRRPCSS